ncbi:plasma membrane protein Pth11-like protein [Xylariomycetidae sp. FL0641]|nr:plasma membrane protein Pth11-like protein [Xylariomycetidae sp. FL0641]
MSSAQEYYDTPGHVIAAAVALSVVDIAAVTLRFLTRKSQKQPLKADDWLMIPATLFQLATVGIGICLVYGVSKESLAYRMKLPDSSVKPLELFTPQLITALKLDLAYTLLNTIALGCIKLSFLYFYMRIFTSNTGRRKVHIFLITFQVFLALWMVAFFSGQLLECGTSSRALRAASRSTKHSELPYWAVAFAGTDLAADIVVLIIPVPLIWGLQLTTRKKLGVLAVFLLGGVTVAISATLLSIVVRMWTADLGPNTDVILWMTTSIYWGMIECGVGVFAACLPTLQSLVRPGAWEPVSNAAGNSKHPGESIARLIRFAPGRNSLGRAGMYAASAYESHVATPCVPAPTRGRVIVDERGQLPSEVASMENLRSKDPEEIQYTF